jgi:hypothetical protein
LLAKRLQKFKHLGRQISVFVAAAVQHIDWQLDKLRQRVHTVQYAIRRVHRKKAAVVPQRGFKWQRMAKWLVLASGMRRAAGIFAAQMPDTRGFTTN